MTPVWIIVISSVRPEGEMPKQKGGLKAEKVRAGGKLIARITEAGRNALVAEG